MILCERSGKPELHDRHCGRSVLIKTATVGGNPVRLTSSDAFASNAVTQVFDLAWSPDGARIAVVPKSNDIYVMNAD